VEQVLFDGVGRCKGRSGFWGNYLYQIFTFLSSIIKIDSRINNGVLKMHLIYHIVILIIFQFFTKNLNLQDIKKEKPDSHQTFLSRTMRTVERFRINPYLNSHVNYDIKIP
jgi:hypothetical protein